MASNVSNTRRKVSSREDQVGYIFRRYIGFAKRFNLTKSTNARAAHKGLVFTGGGVVYAAVIMVAAVVLDNLDFVGFAELSPVIGTSILIAVLGFYDDFTDLSLIHISEPTRPY